MTILDRLERASWKAIFIAGYAAIIVLGIFDYLTGYELAFSLFYVLPISLITWLLGRSHGIAASVVSAVTWAIADVATGHPYSQSFILLWNTLIRFSFFLIITYLLAALRMAFSREKALARTDSLTGALNSRSFYAIIQMEIDRLERYGNPFTLVFIDLDNFKAVNDQLGHATGDQLLQTVVAYAVNHIRKLDVIARLGGDEFVVLLPQTDLSAAQIATAKLQSGLLEQMHKNAWPVTFSMGVLTCVRLPASPNELLKAADALMYTAKREGKNSVRYATYPD